MRLLLIAAALLSHAAYAECPPSGRAGELAQMIIEHEDQLRESLVCDPRLMAFAQARAEDMATRGYFDHVDPENVGPNQRLVETGFPLPDIYPLGRNNSIESMVGGLHQADEVFEALIKSARHRPQILGEQDFFSGQDLFGIGYVYEPRTPEVDIWVIVFAREARRNEPQYNCTPPPGSCQLRPSPTDGR